MREDDGRRHLQSRSPVQGLGLPHLIAVGLVMVTNQNPTDAEMPQACLAHHPVDDEAPEEGEE